MTQCKAERVHTSNTAASLSPYLSVFLLLANVCGGELFCVVAQHGEWDMEMGQPGTVQELKKKFDSGITSPQEGAAGWKAGVTCLELYSESFTAAFCCSPDVCEHSICC